MNKSINIVLSSKNVVSGDAQSATYGINWSAVLDKNKFYKLTYTYLGGSNVYTGSKIPCLYLGFNTTTVRADSTTSTPYTQMIGILKPIVLVAASNISCLQAEENTNLPVELNCPQSNLFTVEIRDNTGALWTDNAATPAKPADYILVLRFTEVN